jgi:beta-galactosidase
MSLVDFQNTANAPRRVLGVGRPLPVEGQWADVEPTRAVVKARFDDGKPALLEAKVGEGSAAVLNFEASRMCHKPGNTATEALILKTILGGALAAPFRADGVLAYRRAAPGADHYFFINEGTARVVNLTTDRAYTSGQDAVTGEAVVARGKTARIKVPARSGRWVRLVRAK